MAAKIINFHARTPAGVSINDLAVTVRAIVYGTDFIDVQWNQESHRTLDGQLQTFTNGIVITPGLIICKGLTKVMGKTFLTWFREDLIYQENRFDILLNGNLIDLGLGEGVDLTQCNYTKNSSEGLYSLHAPGFYNFKIPYEFKRV